jgi:DNA repair exonuclease SbcCD nuclease subunit
MKIFHVADVHLGRRRLDGRLPDTDLVEAFAHVAREAVEGKADVFLIAGDLFDRPQVEPRHLRQAQQVLAILKQANIPVVAIEGNHDRAFIHSADPSWLNYLAEDDLLYLLRANFDANGALLTPWDAQQKRGSWIDLGGVRFVGVGYLGAATPHKLRQTVASLDPKVPHVLLLHAGPEYFVGEGGGFSSAGLQAIRERVCYLALGHIHKPMFHEEWACNPGSLENCDLREAAHEGPRGYAVAHIDPARRCGPVSVEIRDCPRRPCQRLTLNCTPFGNKLKHGAEALVEAAVKLIEAESLSLETVVDLRLQGKLNLDRIALDQGWACIEIEKRTGVCAVAVDTSGLNIASAVAQSEVTAEDISREELEQTAIRNLVEEENLWGLEGHQDKFAELFFELKEGVKAGRSGEQLAEQISRSQLVELIRASVGVREKAAAELIESVAEPTPAPLELSTVPLLPVIPASTYVHPIHPA